MPCCSASPVRRMPPEFRKTCFADAICLSIAEAKLGQIYLQLSKNVSNFVLTPRYLQESRYLKAV